MARGRKRPGRRPGETPSETPPAAGRATAAPAGPAGSPDETATERGATSSGHETPARTDQPEAAAVRPVAGETPTQGPETGEETSASKGGRPAATTSEAPQTAPATGGDQGAQEGGGRAGPPPPPTAPQDRSRTGFAPALLGALVGGIAVGALAWWWGTAQLEPQARALARLEQQLAATGQDVAQLRQALDQRAAAADVAALGQRLEALAGRLDAADQRLQQLAADGRLDELDSQMTVLADQLARLKQELTDLARRPAVAGVAAFEQRLQALEERGGELADALAQVGGRLDGLARELAGLQAGLGAQDSRLGALDRKLRTLAQEVTALAALPKRVAQLEQGLAALREELPSRLAGLEQRLAALEDLRRELKALAGRGQELAAALARLEKAVGEVAGRLTRAEAARAQLGERLAVLERDLARTGEELRGLAGRLDGLAERVERELGTRAEAVLLALVASELSLAAAEGGPVERPLALLARLAARDPALEAVRVRLEPARAAGVPTLAELAQGLERLARGEAVAPSAGGDLLGTTLANLGRLVTVRRKGEAPTTLAAAVEEARKALARDDLAAAIAALEPHAGSRADVAAWLERARVRLEARTVAAELDRLARERLAALLDTAS